jgi:hypothetical protein
MSKTILASVAALVCLVASADALTRECTAPGSSGTCTVTETLSSGVKVTHTVNTGDQFTTSSSSSYVWHEPKNWKTVPEVVPPKPL